PTMSDSYRIPILPESQQLSLSNWQNWKSKIIAIVRVRKLYGHFTGSLTRPADASPGASAETRAEVVAAQQKWDDNDELALTIIITNIVDIASSGLNTDEGRTACQVWAQL
ncbi:hypothetical protein B0H21DRAFT_682931, partial [Amylocystis lapponica]